MITASLLPDAGWLASPKAADALDVALELTAPPIGTDAGYRALMTDHQTSYAARLLFEGA